MIAIQIRDEDGKVESEFDDPHAIYLLLNHSQSETHCLQYIDPHGDTTFNGLQVERLVAELETAGRAIETPEERVRANALIEFLRPGMRAIHTYVKFVGD